jgi:hypothetical protein
MQAELDSLQAHIIFVLYNQPLNNDVRILNLFWKPASISQQIVPLSVIVRKIDSKVQEGQQARIKKRRYNHNFLKDQSWENL